MKAKRKTTNRVKATRNTRKKQIATLVAQGKTYDALKLARGWRLTKQDDARRLVELWQAVQLADDNPENMREAPAGFYEGLLDRAKRATCNLIQYAILRNEPDFFIRIARILKEPEPKENKLHVGLLSERLQKGFRQGETPKRKTPKEIACDIVGKYATPKQIETMTSEVQRLIRKYRRAAVIK